MGKPLILCVDDDEDYCANLSDILSDLGYPVDLAFNGYSALKALGTGVHKLALIDYRIPCMNGVELFRKMKQTRPDLNSILVTAFVSCEATESALQAGMRAILPKPVDFSALLPLIETVVGKSN